MGNLLTLPTADPAQTTMASPFTGQPPWAYRLPAISARQPLETKADYTVPGQGWPLSAQQSTLRPYCLVQAGRDCTSSFAKLIPSSDLVIPSSCQAHVKLMPSSDVVTPAHAKLMPSSYQALTWSQIRSHFFSLSYCRSSRALSGGRFIEL